MVLIKTTEVLYCMAPQGIFLKNFLFVEIPPGSTVSMELSALQNTYRQLHWTTNGEEGIACVWTQPFWKACQMFRYEIVH